MGQAYLALFADNEFARIKNEMYEKASKRGKGRSSSQKPVGPSLDDFKNMTGEQYMDYQNRTGVV